MKKLICLGVSLAVGGFVLITAPQMQRGLWAQTVQEKAQDLVQQGWNLEIQGHLDEAMALYNQALSLDPNSTEAYKHRGTNYARRGAFDKAIPEFEKAISLNPQEASTYYNLGTLYISAAQYEKAILNFSKAIEINPNYLSAISNRAACYAAVRQFNLALDDFNRVVQLAPRDMKGLLGRALVERMLGREQEALADCDTILSINPNDQEVKAFREKLSQSIQAKQTPNFAQEFTVLLGKPAEADRMVLTVGYLYLNSPQGWWKQSDGQHIIYSPTATTQVPQIIVGLDDAKGAQTAIEFTQKMRKVLVNSRPDMVISQPQEEVIKGRPVSYMDFTMTTPQGIKMHLAWYQVLIGQTIVTFTYSNTDYQFQDGLKDLRDLVASVQVK